MKPAVDEITVGVTEFNGKPLAPNSPTQAGAAGPDAYGSVRGTVSIATGIDLTTPTFGDDPEASMLAGWDRVSR